MKSSLALALAFTTLAMGSTFTSRANAVSALAGRCTCLEAEVWRKVCPFPDGPRAYYSKITNRDSPPFNRKVYRKINGQGVTVQCEPFQKYCPRCLD